MANAWHVSYLVNGDGTIQHGDAVVQLGQPLTAQNFGDLRALIAKEMRVEPPAIIITSLTKLDEASLIEVPHA